jgi:hypothetical protein
MSGSSGFGLDNHYFGKRNLRGDLKKSEAHGLSKRFSIINSITLIFGAFTPVPSGDLDLFSK